ncbi:hypothetical protein ACFY04_39200 [Streptomyces sp. NPDC001549]|uniref:hypothetical protein n=1 Tax=Streptomyces sp. NPDC001549 TaxID=3364586 RepID=UPI0036C249DB
MSPHTVRRRRRRYQKGGVHGMVDGRHAPRRPVLGQVSVCRPGELMEIDSTPFDVLVRLDNGVVDRVEPVGMVDVAARSITAAVLRPTTKSVDAACCRAAR